MPNFSGLSHVSLSVQDRDVSVRWYQDVLGFQAVATMDEDRWKRSVCMHSSGTLISFTQHTSTAPFDHHNTGLDHISFTVNDRAALDQWQAHFTDLGVEQSQPVETEQATVLSFRDPNGIALEIFHLHS